MTYVWTAEADERWLADVDASASPEDHRATHALGRNGLGVEGRPDGELPEVVIARAEEFAAVEESGAEPVVGSEDDVLIPRGGDAMLYGDGGAGKTTLALDLGFHMAAPSDWLGFRVSRAVHVLVVEVEGPRSLLRRKVARKLEGWPGTSLAGRLMVLESPWAQFTFATPEWRAVLAEAIAEREVDVLIAGPLTRIGMDAAGTLQEVVAFLRFVEDVRAEGGRLLTVILLHHENKGGSVSGAWEGAGDTLLHVEARGNGFTTVHIQKARWSSAAHNTTLDLAWTEGEGFKIKDERDLLSEVEALLADGDWRTVDEIREGVGAGKGSVREVVENEHAERFAMRTGEDARSLGRRSNTRLYQLVEAA